MFERFTERARKVIVFAQEEARRLRHNYIGTEHLLLGMLREGDGVAAQALGASGLSLGTVREGVEIIVGYGEEEPGGQAPFTPRSKRVLEFALKESMRLSHDYIGTEHLLLGLTDEPEGVAARVWEQFGVRRDYVRREVLRRLGTEDPGPAILEKDDVLPELVRTVVEEVMRKVRREESGPSSDSLSVLNVRIEDLELQARYGPKHRSAPGKIFVTLDYSYSVSGDEAVMESILAEEVIGLVSGFVEREEFDAPESVVLGIGGRIFETFPDIRDIKVAVRPDEVESSRPVGNVTIWSST